LVIDGLMAKWSDCYAKVAKRQSDHQTIRPSQLYSNGSSSDNQLIKIKTRFKHSKQFNPLLIPAKTLTLRADLSAQLRQVRVAFFRGVGIALRNLRLE